VQRIENKAKTSSGKLARVKVINQEVESSNPRLAWGEDFPSDLTRPITRPDPPVDWRSTTVDRWSGGGLPPLTAVDRWSGGGSGDDDGIVPTPRGTTQVVTRGILMIRCQVASTRYCSSEVAVRGGRECPVAVRGGDGWPIRA
ncbi:hypothetical protein Tco_1441568, partial [Tanacetum coccineum]